MSRALLATERRGEAVQALSRVIDEEVATKRGLTGTAVRAAYAAVRRLDRGVVPRAVDELLPHFAAVLDGYWSEGDLAGELQAHANDVADALLGVTDDEARNGPHVALAVIYHTLRPHAVPHVRQALPRLGRAVSALVEGPRPPHEEAPV